MAAAEEPARTPGAGFSQIKTDTLARSLAQIVGERNIQSRMRRFSRLLIVATPASSGIAANCGVRQELRGT